MPLKAPFSVALLISPSTERMGQGGGGAYTIRCFHLGQVGCVGRETWDLFHLLAPCTAATSPTHTPTPSFFASAGHLRNYSVFVVVFFFPGIPAVGKVIGETHTNPLTQV